MPAGLRRRWPPFLLGLLSSALVVAGAALLVAYFVVPAYLAPDARLRFGAMAVGALLALPPLLAYFWVPRLIGSLDPQPFRELVFAFVFGAFAASGFSALFNTIFERALVVLGEGLGRSDAVELASFLSGAIGAPFIEEMWKGLAVIFALRLFRRGADPLQDGVVLATFSGIGFATVENVVYYARAALDEVQGAREGAIAATFVVRGLLSPWGHPLYAALTGLGLGLTRALGPGRWRRIAPWLGFLGAVVLHGLWNGIAMLSEGFADALLPLAFAFVVLFIGLFGGLMVRQSRIVRHQLRPEVEGGVLTLDELFLVASPFSRLKATFRRDRFGDPGFVTAAARLAFCRWHAARSAPGSSARAELEARCDELRIALGRLSSRDEERARSRVVAG